jgi:hypothetical protein
MELALWACEMSTENHRKTATGFLVYFNFIGNIAPNNNYISVHEGSGQLV